MFCSYCGRRFSSVIISEVNYIGLTLSSGVTGTGNGFKASVSLITGKYILYFALEYRLDLK